MNQQITAVQRRYELDWLRIIAILLVFVFHTARFFDAMDWHVKNPVTYPALDTASIFITSWMMPLVFVISGASVFYATGKSGSGKFLQSKVSRLLIPLLVAAFTHLPLQVYLERITHHQFAGSFWEFLPRYFDGIYGWYNGNFAITGMHLWYLWLLFLFTLIFAPLFRWVRRGLGQKVIGRFGDFLALPGMVYLLVLPLYLFLNWLNPNKGLGTIIQGGWSMLLYIPFYLAGFVLYSHTGLLERVRQFRWVSLAAGFFSLIFLLVQTSGKTIPLWGTERYQQLSLFYCLNSWSWILAFLGFAQQRLTFTNPFMKYANEAVLPFYILHQTVLLCVGYFVVQWSLPALAAYLVIAAVSLAIIMGLYEFLVRRINLLRFLFGMKLTPKAAVTPQGEPALQQL
jgi:peptidoglycan/LPS O-acetylase OafA/YrhL